MNQHALSNVHPDAKIAEDVVIEPFVTIEADVEIEEGTWIGPNAVILNGSRIGKNCKIYPGAVISQVPQDLKFNGENTTTIIKDGTTVREYATISRGTSDRDTTVVGKNCLVMAYVHIAHDCLIGDNCIFSNSVQIAGHAEIGDHVVIGGTAALHQFVKVGDHSMVAAGALLRKDVPPYIKAAKEPVVYCGLNLVGLRRKGFSNESIDQIHNIYRDIYQSEKNFSESVKHIEEARPQTEERDAILNFVKSSTRGIIASMR